MHELGLVAELVDAATSFAGTMPVATVHVRHSTTIPDEVLRQAFAMLTCDGPLASAELVAEPFDTVLLCPCGFDGVLGHDDVIGPGAAACPSCGNLREIPVTPELELLEVRLAG